MSKHDNFRRCRGKQGWSGTLKKVLPGLSRKQWGLDPSELDARVAARVPPRTDRDSRYFTDSYRSMPLHGYTRMFETMLDHPNIRIILQTDNR